MCLFCVTPKDLKCNCNCTDRENLIKSIIDKENEEKTAFYCSLCNHTGIINLKIHWYLLVPPQLGIF